ncbi:MAG: glycoside hydrolase family 127 protein [Oscillospiraceae bacterium]|nr:glycoside hydrolase family 127 protein [Oscillospiraceae bacterium]MDD4368498.1 glycoside hydrolase family 127 protein [Oscillospiraceae bacterium]
MQPSQPITLEHVQLTNGFWQQRQDLNRRVSVPNVYQRFAESGRFEAFRFDWKPGMPNQPHIFWDSDAAKWIESASYLLQQQRDPALEAQVDELVDLIAAHQEPGGYFNIYFTVCQPDQRFQNRTEHELYDAGHLIEAAVAYARATGKEKFLGLMCRYADYIEEVFKTHHQTAFYTPGHEEIELALVKLWHYTGERRYLELSKWFVEERGRHPEEKTYDYANARYDQHHLPVREQTTAEGHAVRAMYLYTAMADLAGEYQDQSLLDACLRLFDNITQRRMYITGGIGSARQGEAFTLDYDLPNLTAYTESCAAIGLMLFSWRLLQLKPDRRFADAFERAMYNGFISGISLDGKAFFYENPLEIVPELRQRDASLKESRPLAATQRSELFSCSCCPPNITRILASLSSYLYTQSQDTLYIHQYMASQAQLTAGARLTVETDYPRGESISLRLQGWSGRRLALRIPGWCRHYELTQDGHKLPLQLENGYAVVLVEAEDCQLQLTLAQPVTFYAAQAAVRADAGKVAVVRGPVVYCAEAIDNGPDLWALTLDTTAASWLEPDALSGLDRIVLSGYRQQQGAAAGEEDLRDKQSEPLYLPQSDLNETPQTIRLIPYFAFANRGETEMAVWLRPHL